MGNNATKINKSDREIKSDIININNLTKSITFEKRVGLNLEFNYNTKTRKIIATLVFINNLVQNT